VVKTSKKQNNETYKTLKTNPNMNIFTNINNVNVHIL